MTDVSKVKALVIDHGLFLPLALKLGEQFETVYYWTPRERAFPTVNEGMLGQGFDQITPCRDIWSVVENVDVVVFPDIQHAGLQIHLHELGIPVWGSRNGDQLEMHRGEFLSQLNRLDLDAPNWTVVRGVTQLREHLREREDKYIKISRYRGSMETWHWRSWKEDEGELDQLAHQFGPAKDKIPFIVLDSVDADVEVGYDGYCVNGQFPSIGIQGYEAKDRAFLCRAQKYSSLPEPVRRINEAFAPILRKNDYRNFWSTEIRVNGDKAFFIDPCCRCPSPSTECQLALYENIGEIIWNGARGILVDPKLSARFAASAVITAKADRSEWIIADFPHRLRSSIACSNCCDIDGRICYPPNIYPGPELGWLVATGNDVSSTIESLKEKAAEMPENVEVHLAEIADLITELEDAKDEGIEFSSDLPAPSIAVS